VINTKNFDTGYDVYFLVLKDLDGFMFWYERNKFSTDDFTMTLKDGVEVPATVKGHWPTLRKLVLRDFPNVDWLKANDEPFGSELNANQWAKSRLGNAPEEMLSGISNGIIDYNVIPCWAPAQIRIPDAEWITYIEEFESLEHLTAKLQSSKEPIHIVQILNTEDPITPITVVLKVRRIGAYFEKREIPPTY